MNVSKRTLSLWETDLIYPKWSMQPLIVRFLGHDPFDNPTLGAPKSNRTEGIALLRSHDGNSFGKKLCKYRLQRRKTRKDFAADLGVSVKAVWEWESARRIPSRAMLQRISGMISGG